MSERRAKSISGPQTRQAWLNGKGEGAVKKCEVWRDETEIEILGETTVASPVTLMSKDLLVTPHEELLGELSGELREEDGTVGSWRLCVEIGGRRYELDAVAEEHLDGAAVARLTLHLAGASKPIGILGMFDVGTEVRIVRASTRREYYGTLHCISRQADAYARKMERLEREWRTKNRLPLWTTNGTGEPHFNPLPDSAKDEVETEAAVGTYVIGFEDFVDDSGPISPTLPDGSLNEPALLDLMKIGPFRAALEEFYAEEKFSYEQHTAEKKRQSNSSNGI